MQEIEIKFKVDNLEVAKDKLKQQGCIFSEKLYQKDTVFVPSLRDTSNGEGKMFARVRTVNGRSELNLKKQSSKLMQSKEIEFEVSNYDSAYDFLETIGLHKWVTVEKKRITTKYKEFNICLDEVKRLGNFIEIEILTNEEDKTEYYEKIILECAEYLGIDINNRINSFYDAMMNKLEKEN
jgi:adenylate cyclase class 2